MNLFNRNKKSLKKGIYFRELDKTFYQISKDKKD